MTAKAEEPFNVEAEVAKRYSEGAKALEPSLCCPVTYDGQYLAVLPKEIIEKDYGCGDPTAYVESGETVLDLGSGGGKACYIISQKVGASGHVIGVDINDDMLGLAKKHQASLADKIGWSNVEFRKGKIQDLRTDLQWIEGYLSKASIESIDDYSRFEASLADQRKEQPLVSSNSIDVIVSNCVLNLVATEQKRNLFDEMFRVLKPGGRCVISDIVSDERPSQAIMDDPKLWSGCISGAFLDSQFVEMFENAGFVGIEVLKRDNTPWQTIDGIHFRSMTVRAYKSVIGSNERAVEVVYPGPWKKVVDDHGREYTRGKREIVTGKSASLAQFSLRKQLLHTSETETPPKTGCC